MNRIATYCMIVWMVAVTAAIHARDIQTNIPVVELDFDTLSTDTFFMGQMRLITPCDTMIRIDTIICPDSIILNDTVIRIDTTIIDPDTLIHVDTLVVQDTLIRVDTLVVKDTITIDTMRLRILIRHRGSSSLVYKKQSFAIKLIDSLGAKLDTSLLGMRNDNYWILDAMAPDKARMRNRVAFDLWLDFSSKPHYYEKEPELINGINGQFVEVNVNGKYNGLYCLMERVDRKQLKLKKMKDGVVRGILYKSVRWRYGFFSVGLPSYNTQSETWGCYDFEYPDTAGYIPWKPLYDNMRFAIRSTNKQFLEQAPLRYDLPVLIDLYLFNALLSARDGMGKNLFVSYYNITNDSMLVVTPWDIDHSFGRMYNGNEEDPETEFTDWALRLYPRLEQCDESYIASRNARYAALRHEQFSAHALKERFAQYFELFRQTGADLREEQRWGGIDKIDLDFAAEEQYIYKWIDQRLAFCDNFFNYISSVTTALPEAADPSNSHSENCSPVSKELINGHLYLRKGEQLYDLQGWRVR